jgi:4-amino-4-deoxy-L-arabinose transferase-like glycosyltransferase
LKLNSSSNNVKFIRLFLIFASVVLFFSPLPRAYSLGFIGILIGILIISFFSSFAPKIRYALFIAFALRVSLILIYTYSEILPQFGVLSDVYVFEPVGIQFSQNGFQWLFGHFVSGTYLYSWFIGFIYSLVGRSPFLIQVINAILGTVVVWIIYSTAVLLWGERKGKYASWIVAVFPSMVFFSSFIFREEPIIFTYSLGVLLLIRWQLAKRNVLYIFSLLLFALSLGFHTGMLSSIIIPVLPLVAELFSSIRSRKYKSFAKGSMLLLLSLILIFAIFKTGWGMDKIGSSGGFSFHFLSNQEETASRGRALYLSGLSIKKPLDILWQAPIRVFYFLFAPFIWMIQAPLDFIGFLDAILYILLCWGILRGWHKIQKSKLALAIFILLVFEVVAFALTTSNYGTALRHRAKFVPLFVLLAVANFEQSYCFILSKVLRIKISFKGTEDEG